MTVMAYILCIYFLLSIVLTYLVHRMPRRPVMDYPDWGKVTDHRIPAFKGGFLEVWRVEPDGPSRGVVVLAHGWSRNRARMINRAKMFGKWGFTTIIHSARDHGGSSKLRLMNGVRFGQDVRTVLEWAGEPVILYGHSAGAAGAVIAASKTPDSVRVLFLEGCYAETKPALMNLYKSFNRWFGLIFGPAIIFWMDKVLYPGRVLDRFSPVSMAPGIRAPVMMIHGEEDLTFPVAFAETLMKKFPENQARLWIAKGAGHSESSFQPGYEDAVRKFLEDHGAMPQPVAKNGA